MNLNEIRAGLLSLIRLEGYTKASYAKKCSLDVDVFKAFLSGDLKLGEVNIDNIIDKAVTSQGMSFNDLDKYIKKETELILLASTDGILAGSVEYNPRDVSRIEPFLEEFKELWISKPDLRFGQLVECLSRQVEIDPFYIEDDTWLQSIRDMNND